MDKDKLVKVNDNCPCPNCVTRRRVFGPEKATTPGDIAAALRSHAQPK